MQVFTREWIGYLKTKYDKHARYNRPAIYYYAIDPEFEILRQEIETWIGYLSDDAKSKIIPRLHSKENFLATYNELFCGHLFTKLGYHIEYEMSFQSPDKLLTPDWYISKKDIESLVEVLH